MKKASQRGGEAPPTNMKVSPKTPSIKTSAKYLGGYVHGTKARYSAGPGKAKEGALPPGYLFKQK
jgi:hypothetical protein